MQVKSILRNACSTAAVSLMMAGAGLAHGSVDREDAGQLKNLVEGAELGFLGQVIDVSYSVEKTGGEGGDKSTEPSELPVVYVTYAVEKVIFGKPASEKLTLRFLGGPDGSGRFFSVSGTPRFQIKEQDVLFVSGNGAEGCPLVTCEYGRFRVLRGGLYDAFGVAVQAIVDQGVIARGEIPKEFLRFAYPTPEFDAVMRQPRAQAMLKERGLSVDEARKLYIEQAPREIVMTTDITRGGEDRDREREADKQPEDPGAIMESDEPLQQSPIAVEEFIEHVAKLAEANARERRPIESLEPGRFPLPALSLSAPNPEKRLMDLEDEEGSVRENEGNPVIKQ